jgi:serine/threonine protein kinase
MDTTGPFREAGPEGLDLAMGTALTKRYEVLGEVGRGAMGVVYKARWRKLNLTVALKVMRTHHFGSQEALARFYVEAGELARLYHPNIVRIYDCGECNGLPYFAMEFVERGSLSRQLAGRPLAALQAAELVGTLARAIHYVHEAAGVIHRDLKPANVLLAGGGIPKIADFGIVKQVDRDTGEGLVKGPDEQTTSTRTGVILGTPSYMAPEQAAGKTKEVGRAADIYALGATLYETLTGRPPFKGGTVEETLRKVLYEEPVSPSHLQPTVPSELAAVCLRCLEKEPSQRYARAEALAVDLQRRCERLHE